MEMADKKDDITDADDEPSIEEILSSIRDIIADEDEEGDSALADEEVDADEENEDDEKKEDILDLTEIVKDADSEDLPEEDSMADSEKPEDEMNDPLAGINLSHPKDDLDVFDTEPEEDDGVSDILSEVAKEQETQKEKPAYMTEPAKVVPPVDFDTDTDGGLLDKAAAVATVSSMARLAENIAVSRTAAGTTLEDIVRDLLRPMLKEWLDENLPTVIERLVAQELERLAEKAARK